MNTKQDNLFSTICYMANGNPAPEVMTEEDVVAFLRLDTDGTGASVTLKYYRDKGLLKGIRIGKKLRYTRREVLRFLDRLTEQADASTD